MKYNSIYSHINALSHLLKQKGVETKIEGDVAVFSFDSTSIDVAVVHEKSTSNQESALSISLDFLVLYPEKVEGLICSKLGLNQSIFARKCSIQKISKEEAAKFLTQYHLFGSTQSAFNYGLIYDTELIAVATFSKGRKMHRLQTHERSYELIRFCCKNGISVSGGLSKLVKHFVNEKKAGDVMTYVDKQLSDGKSFLKAGFKKHSETEASSFLVNRITLERKALRNKVEVFDAATHYLTQNAGSIKLIYSAKN